jgi:hypothetical protein
VSPSSTERPARWWIPRAPRRPSAGLAIGRDYVGFAAVLPARGGWRAQALAEARLETPLFSGAPAPEARAALAAALRKLGRGVARRFVPVHVSVPDAAVQWGMFELEEMPKASAAQLDLARLRFSRQGLNGGHACACQRLPGGAGKELLLGMALDEGWRRCISDSLDDAGVRAWSLSANVCRRFNRFHEQLAQTSGALVALAPDAWSLLLWDELGRPRYARARWRAAPGADHAEIALEVERSILAFVQGAGERTVARVFTAAGDETAAMAAALDARMREPCVRLAAQEGGATADLAVAAALER